MLAANCSLNVFFLHFIFYSSSNHLNLTSTYYPIPITLLPITQLPTTPTHTQYQPPTHPLSPNSLFLPQQKKSNNGPWHKCATQQLLNKALKPEPKPKQKNQN